MRTLTFVLQNESGAGVSSPKIDVEDAGEFVADGGIEVLMLRLDEMERQGVEKDPLVTVPEHPTVHPLTGQVWPTHPDHLIGLIAQHDGMRWFVEEKCPVEFEWEGQNVINHWGHYYYGYHLDDPLKKRLFLCIDKWDLEHGYYTFWKPQDQGVEKKGVDNTLNTA